LPAVDHVAQGIDVGLVGGVVARADLAVGVDCDARLS